MVGHFPTNLWLGSRAIWRHLLRHTDIAVLCLPPSCVISSIAGAWNDQMLKSDNGVSMHVINMLLYAFGFMMNGTSYIYIADPERYFFRDLTSLPHTLSCFVSLHSVSILVQSTILLIRLSRHLPSLVRPAY